jgi:hypothetical protein
VVTSAQQLTQFETAIEDWVLKPVYSRFGSRTLLHGSKETWNTVQPTPLEPWLAQRRVCGIEYCTYAIAVNGRVTAFAAYHSKYRTRNLRQEPAAGVYFEPSDQPELLDFTRRVVAELSFTGQIAFDIIVGKGKTWVLECNPRATSGLHLLNVNDPTPYLEGLANDLWTTTPEPRMLAPAMFLLPEKWRAVRDMLRARDVVYASDDRLPLFYAWRFLLELRRQARVLGISLEDACTADIEWNGETPEAQPPQVPVSGK